MAGEVQAIIRRSALIAGIAVGGATETVTGDTHAAYHQIIPNPSTDYAVDFPVTVAHVQACLILADQNLDLYTNDVHSGSPTQHIVLTANVPLIWTVSQPSGTKVLTADVTVFYVGNASGVAATLTIAIVSNSH